MSGSFWEIDHTWGHWDSASLLVTISALLDVMPKVAALLAVIVWGLRIYRDPTVQGWLASYKRWRNNERS